MQGGLEIPLSVKLAVATKKNNMLIDRFRELVNKLKKELADEIIMGSVSFDDFTEIKDPVSDTENETVMPQSKKRKPDKTFGNIAQKTNKELASSKGTKDIRTVFITLPKEKNEDKGMERAKI